MSEERAVKRIESLGKGIGREHQIEWKKKKNEEEVVESESEKGFLKFIERECGVIETKYVAAFKT